MKSVMETMETMAQESTASVKRPIVFVVLPDASGNKVAVPAVATEFAGGNSVMIVNNTDGPLTVTHDGHLDAPDPFVVGAGGPPVKHPLVPDSDVSGNTFQLHITGSPAIRAAALGVDPTIIIL